MKEKKKLEKSPSLKVNVKRFPITSSNRYHVLHIPLASHHHPGSRNSCLIMAAKSVSTPPLVTIHLLLLLFSKFLLPEAVASVN